MFYKKLSMLVVLAVTLGSVFVTPAAAKGNQGSFIGTEIFVKFIDPGKTRTTPEGQTILRNQTIVNFKYSTDERLTGINIITFDAVFDKAGTGPAEGKFRIQAGTFEGQASMSAPPMVHSAVDPCKGAPEKKAEKQCYQYDPQYYGPDEWLVFYSNGGGWEGRFTSMLANYGATPLTGRAEGVGVGHYGGLRVLATSSGYTYSGTIQ